MRTIPHKANGNDYLLIGDMETDAHQIRIEPTTTNSGQYREWFCYYTERRAVSVSADLPPGEWIPIGLASELTEEQKKEIAQEVEFELFPGESIKAYEDYMAPHNGSKIPMAYPSLSVSSLCKSHSLNPITTFILKKKPL